MPLGRPTWIDAIELSPDGRNVTATFVGGAAPEGPNDFCSAAYTGWSQIHGDVLEIGVFETPQTFTATFPPHFACTAVGYPRSIEIQLARPFDGSEWEDAAGYRHFLRSPAGLYDFTVPPSWKLISERDVELSRTGRWERVFAQSPEAGPDETLSVYQSFDGPIGITGGDDVSTVDVNGRTATLYRDKPSGELLLTWSQDGDGFALVAYERTLTVDDLIAIAASARQPAN